MTESPDPRNDQRPVLERSVTRRALVKAGWAVPLVLASASLPKSVFAQSSGATCVDPNTGVTVPADPCPPLQP